jgi:pimeloyl-ACP methyl ester carboxylesterase
MALFGELTRPNQTRLIGNRAFPAHCIRLTVGHAGTPENAQRLAFPGAVVFYSWPSDASLKAYFTDTQKAENSGPALARVIESLLAAAPDGPIYLVAHSMGNRVALNALIELREAKPPR